MTQQQRVYEQIHAFVRKYGLRVEMSDGQEKVWSQVLGEVESKIQQMQQEIQQGMTQVSERCMDMGEGGTRTCVCK